MQTIGVEAVELANGAAILIPGKGMYLITQKSVNGIFVQVEMVRQGITERTWFYLNDIVNKVI